MDGLIWALIIVTGTANVSVSTGYPNRQLCEDAISVVRTGMTVAEKKADDDRAAMAAARRKQEWRAAHPPREPTAEDKKKCINNDAANGVIWGGSTVTCSIEKDGLVYQYDPLEMMGRSSITVFNPATEIKYAKCVMMSPPS